MVLILKIQGMINSLDDASGHLSSGHLSRTHNHESL